MSSIPKTNPESPAIQLNGPENSAMRLIKSKFEDFAIKSLTKIQDKEQQIQILKGKMELIEQENKKLRTLLDPQMLEQYIKENGQRLQNEIDTLKNENASLQEVINQIFKEQRF